MSLYEVIQGALNDVYDPVSGFGIAATYAPRAESGVDPFSCLIVPGTDVEHDQVIERHVLSDQWTVHLLHSSLAAAGLSEPVAEIGNQAGDLLHIPGPDGGLQSWVIRGRRLHQTRLYWILELERNQRVIP
jgi:hypothetical protein